MGIRAEHLSKSFESRKVLDDISFEIKDGEFASFLAPTGEGKTTLLRILAGIERPDQGRVYYNDEDVTDWPVQKRRIAMVFQWFVNYPSMTVFENIATPLEALRPKPSKSEIEQRVQGIAQLLKIDGLMPQYPSQISGGQQQRLAIARALVKNSDFIFLDEPLTNLDYKLQEELRVELKNIFARKEHGAVVFATPQPIEALTLSTSVGFLNGGKLLQFGPMQEVYHRPAFMEVAAYFSHPSMNIFEVRKVMENGHLWLKASDQLKLRVNRSSAGEGSGKRYDPCHRHGRVAGSGRLRHRAAPGSSGGAARRPPGRRGRIPDRGFGHGVFASGPLLHLRQS
jgi:glycerol transport system ATP-binding protein